jgi:hypothetical protein
MLALPLVVVCVMVKHDDEIGESRRQISLHVLLDNTISYVESMAHIPI